MTEPVVVAAPGASAADVHDAEAAAAGFAVFDTAIGHCSLAWGPRGLVGVQLPEVDGSAEAKRARMARDFPRLAQVPEPQRSPAVRAAIDAIVALLSDRSATDPAGVDAASEGRTFATVSTATVLAGSALLALSATLLVVHLQASDDLEVTAAGSLDGGGLRARATF